MSSRDQEEFVAGFIEQEAELQLWIQFTLPEFKAGPRSRQTVDKPQARTAPPHPPALLFLERDRSHETVRLDVERQPHSTWQLHALAPGRQEG